MTGATARTQPTPIYHTKVAAPDRRLAGLFSRRSTTAPATAGSIGIISTYPPTQCGLATFTASLRDGLLDDRPDLTVGIVRVGAEHRSTSGPEVIHEVGTDAYTAATALNTFDIAIIQHEYGIYGGTDGDQVLDVLEWIRVPVIAVVHTVLVHPTPRQRFILETLVRTAAAVVTMSETGRRRLLDDYGTDPTKVVLIPHGAKAFADRVTRPAGPGRRPMILTWGLLGPGKGIEWGIAALRGMRELTPTPRYVVAGQTHPKVLASAGEQYRESLVTQAQELGVTDLLEFVPGYLNAERLRALVQEADVVLLPYDSHDQVT